MDLKRLARLAGIVVAADASVLTPLSIASAAAVGTPVVTNPGLVIPTGIASQAAAGVVIGVGFAGRVLTSGEATVYPGVTFTTASVATPGSCLIWVDSYRSTIAPVGPPPPTISGLGLTWSLVTSTLFMLGNRTWSLHLGAGVGTTVGPLTVTYTFPPSGASSWVVMGLSKPVEVVQAEAQAADDATLVNTITLDAVPTAGNLLFVGNTAYLQEGVSSLFTPEAGWTELFEGTTGEFAPRMQVAQATTLDQTVTTTKYDTFYTSWWASAAVEIGVVVLVVAPDGIPSGEALGTPSFPSLQAIADGAGVPPRAAYGLALFRRAVRPTILPGWAGEAILSGISSKISLRMTGTWRPGA